MTQKQNTSSAGPAAPHAETLYRALMANPILGFWLMDENGRFLQVNDAYLHRSGYTRPEMLSMHIADMEASQTPAAITAYLDKAKKQGHLLLASQHRTKTGAVWSVELNLTYDNGRFLTFLRDITTQEQQRHALLTERIHLRNLLNTIPDMVWLKDPDGCYLACNPAFERFMGAAETDILGKNDFAFFDPETAEFFRQHDHNAILSAKPSTNEEWVTTAEDNQRILLETIKTPFFDNAGNLLGVLGIARNITERKKAEKTLQEQVELQRQLAQIAATVPGMICSFQLRPDGSTCMPFTSPALNDIYGLDAAALAQNAAPLFDIMHPEDRQHVHETIAQSARTMSQWHAEYRVQHPRKGEVWVEGRSVPHLQADGSILWHGFIQDITARKRVEQAVRRMSEAQEQIANLNDLDEVYKLVGRQVQELLEDGYIVTSIYDEQIQAMRIAGLYGLGGRYEALVQRFKIDPTQMTYALADMTAAELRIFRSGRLEKFEDGLYALLTRKVPRRICELAEKQLGISAIYTMGFVWHDFHYGGLIILAKQDIAPYRDMIETIMNQASIAIKRIRSEKALRSSEEKLQLFIEHAPAALAMFDREMRYLAVSRRWLTDFYLEDQEIMGRSHYDVFPEISQGLKAIHQRGLAGEIMAVNEDKFVRADGRVQWLAWEMRPWYTADESIGGIVIFSEDITVRKETEGALEDLQAILASAESVAKMGSWKWNLKTQKLTWSDEMFNLFGIDQQAFDGDLEKVINERIHPDDIAAVQRSNISVLEKLTPVPLEYRLVLPDGVERTVWAEGKLAYDARTQEPTALVGYVQDITARKEAEATITQLNRRMELILNSAGEGIYGTDINGRITFVNPTMAQMTGWEPSELLGRDAHATFHHSSPDGSPHPAAECSIFVAMRKEREYHTAEELYWRKDGRCFPVEFTSTPIKENDHVTGMVVVVRDITERKQAEAEQARLEDQLRQSQKMESIGRLAGGVAHDFNNHLTIIQIYSELMRERMAPNDPLIAKIERIHQASERAANLTRQLLAFSRKQMLQPVVLDLNELVENLKIMMGRLIGEDIIFSTVMQPGLWPVTADPSQIEQVIINLVVNARDAMPTGGMLTLETHNAFINEPHSAMHLEGPSGPCVMLSVTDTGVGMEKEVQAQIFEPFFTTKDVGKGTGLGLAMVHGIVKQSNGAIYVYSEPGQGTTFKIYLPANENAVESSGDSPLSGYLQQGTETILLAEDEEALRELVRVTLEELGYTILEAKTPLEALKLADQHGGEVDLLLTDVVMPEMSGRHLAQELMAQFPKLKVLFMSGYTDDAIVRHGLRTSEVAFLSKPFSRNVLAAKVREVLDKDD